MKIALDAMGGDQSPAEQVKGALLAVKALDIDIALVGPPEPLEAELARHPHSGRIFVVPSEGAIEMEEDEIVRTVRQRPDASINVAMGLVKSGEAAACVSAGNTGAVMASAFFVLGRVPGIERPALSLIIPYLAGRVLFIDVGANVDCRPNHLVQFAQMGSVYVEKVIGISRPRVALLSNGEEASKGNELVLEAHERLKDSGLNFIGNVEGVNVHKSVADVIVADGFTGNIALKVGEGIADYILQQVTSVVKSNILYVTSALLLKSALKRALKRLQYEEYGGANLLGVNGVVVIAHGRSDATAIKNALMVAKDAAGSGLMETMLASFSREQLRATPAGDR